MITEEDEKHVRQIASVEICWFVIILILTMFISRAFHC